MKSEPAKQNIGTLCKWGRQQCNKLTRSASVAQQTMQSFTTDRCKELRHRCKIRTHFKLKSEIKWHEDTEHTSGNHSKTSLPNDAPQRGPLTSSSADCPLTAKGERLSSNNMFLLAGQTLLHDARVHPSGTLRVNVPRHTRSRPSIWMGTNLHNAQVLLQQASAPLRRWTNRSGKQEQRKNLESEL